MYTKQPQDFTGYTFMNSKAGQELDWHWVRSFLAVLDTGSLSGAAQQLSLSQPTLGRHIQLLEAHCDHQLFERSNQGLIPTNAALAMRESAEAMRSGANGFMRQLQGQQDTLRGTIRLSVNELVAVYLLPPAVCAFREKHPEVQLEIVVTNNTSSLSKREADMALRMFRPTEAQVLAVKLADMPLGFFASKDYLAKHGEPQELGQLTSHTLIGFDNETAFIEAAADLGWPLTPKDFEYRCDNLLMAFALMRAGAGILVTHCGLAQQLPNIQQVCHEAPLPQLQLWIASHRDLLGSARMQALSQFLQTWFQDNAYHQVQI